MTIFSCERETDTLFAIVIILSYNETRSRSCGSRHRKKELSDKEKMIWQ